MGALYHHERRLLARPGVLRFAQSDGVDLSGVDQVESHVQGGAKRHQETHRSEDFQQEGGTGEFEFVKTKIDVKVQGLKRKNLIFSSVGKGAILKMHKMEFFAHN
jgi:hypothetical protein